AITERGGLTAQSALADAPRARTLDGAERGAPRANIVNRATAGRSLVATDVRQEAELSRFGELVVGSWTAPDSRHTFEWGVDRKVLKSASYGLDGDDWQLVSEGFWYWDPAAGVIRGRTVAVGMGIDLFEYTSRIADSGNEIVHELIAHGQISGSFIERWRFEGDSYVWTLEQEGARVMGGEYRRVR
ncbi:MAG: hypothetical protein HKO77_10295, partial [Gemmatimonadetes bacterium]|nr:hypothetical protein [Gemmatimonadota bacterium]